jgi:YVTN family beta-propeller protein
LPVGIAVNPTTNKIYVTNQDSNYLSVIDGSTNKVINNIKVGSSPFNIALNPVNNAIYVANSRSNTVSIVDASSNNITATVNINIVPRNAG